ncbi:MAG: tetratricopeptide repeat protein [Promethearchaeota archaeon]
MAKINIIPQKIPKQFWEKDQYEDVILYALTVFGPLKREEFLNNKDKGINNRMNKNTFHKWAKKLKIKNYIQVSREGKYSLYKITNSGTKELLKRLKSCNLDMKTILNLERKSMSKFFNLDIQFLKNYEIENEDIIIDFLKLKNEMPRDKINRFSEEKVNRVVLYLTLNHPKFYDFYSMFNISIDDFIDKYGNGILSRDELKDFLHKLSIKKISGISFYKLKLPKNGINLYFRSSEEFGSIFEIIIQSVLRDYYYLQCMHNNKFPEIILNEICDKVLTILREKCNLFHEDLEIALYDTIKYYLLTLIKELKVEVLNQSFELYEIPTLIKTSKIFNFETLEYLQKRSLFHLEEAYNSQLDFEYWENIKYASDFIRKAIGFDRSNAYNFALKAQILHFLGQYDEALQTIYKAIELDPQEASFYSDLAFFLNRQSKYEEALNAIKQAIELDPYNAEHYSYLSTIYWSLNQNEKALEALNQAIEKAPQNIRNYIRKANCLAHDLQKYNSALKIIDKAFKLKMKKIELFELYDVKAGILLCMKNRGAAVNIIKKARQLYPNKEIYPNIG